MAGFRINYGQVVRQANEIDNLSDELGREISKLDSLFMALRSNWQGPASNAFQNHLTVLINDMKNTKNSMSGTADTIRYVARTIQEEDERQAELARQLAEAKAAEAAKAAKATIDAVSQFTEKVTDFIKKPK